MPPVFHSPPNPPFKLTPYVMKTPLSPLCSAIFLTGLFHSSPTMGNEKESAEKMDPKMAEMMKKTEEFGAPPLA